jgi:FMN phosphatase YigB (HAD superfamily)
MTFRKVLAVDIDGVVLDHAAGMHAWALKKGIEVGCPPAECHSYTMSPMFPGMSHEEIMQLMVEFSHEDEFSALPIMPGFENAISRLKNLHPDLELIAITAPGSSQRTRQLREHNLRLFPFEEIHILDMHSSKRAHLKRLPKSAIFFDDLAAHVLAAENVGLKSVLFRQPHNLQDDHTLIAQNWDVGFEIVRREFEDFPLLERE